jgi:hypothetical protein
MVISPVLPKGGIHPMTLGNQVENKSWSRPFRCLASAQLALVEDDMFNFQKHRINTERLDRIPTSAELGRVFRLNDPLPKEPSVVMVVPVHSLELEAQIASRIHAKLLVVGDCGSSEGFSLHSDDVSEVLKAQIKPLDISQMLGRTKAQR